MHRLFGLTGVGLILALGQTPLAAAATTEDTAAVRDDTAGLMTLIPGGICLCGDEGLLQYHTMYRPIRLTIPSFFLDETPVTNQSFRRFVDATQYVTQAETVLAATTPEARAQAGFATGLDPDSITGTWMRPVGPEGPEPAADRPVVQVTATDAEAFCAWAGKRLPTEFEYEFAAGGRAQWSFPLHNNDTTFDGLRNQYNYGERSFDRLGGVSDLPENDLGLRAMAGHVWQWTSSYLDPTYYASLETDAIPPAYRGGAGLRVLKGGSWASRFIFELKAAWRLARLPATVSASIGFRCGRSLS